MQYKYLYGSDKQNTCKTIHLKLFYYKYGSDKQNSTILLKLVFIHEKRKYTNWNVLIWNGHNYSGHG